MHKSLLWFQGGGLFLMSKVPLSSLHPQPQILNTTGVPRSL
jgi:hypothetical protein